jgi:hypothetical protein
MCKQRRSTCFQRLQCATKVLATCIQRLQCVTGDLVTWSQNIVTWTQNIVTWNQTCSRKIFECVRARTSIRGLDYLDSPSPQFQSVFRNKFKSKVK